MALTDLTFSKQGEAYVCDPVQLNRMQVFILNLQVKIRITVSLCFKA